MWPLGLKILRQVEDYKKDNNIPVIAGGVFSTFAPEIVIDSIGTKPNPTLGFGIITDTISQNQIMSRDIKWNFQVPTIYNTKVVKELPKREFYYGFGTSFDQTNFINKANFGILYKDKKSFHYYVLDNFISLLKSEFTDLRRREG